MANSIIVFTGDLLGGFTWYGPFEDATDALAWAGENIKGEDWWTTPLIDPKELEE